MKTFSYIGYTATLIGIAGLAGALETGTGFLTAAAIVIIGAASLYVSKTEGGTYTETDEEINNLVDYHKLSNHRDKRKRRRRKAV